VISVGLLDVSWRKPSCEKKIGEQECLEDKYVFQDTERMLKDLTVHLILDNCKSKISMGERMSQNKWYSGICLIYSGPYTPPLKALINEISEMQHIAV
jgi:hypothetical protein